MFTYMLEGLARVYAPRLDDALCIGMGIGIVPRDLAASGSRVDVVEINPAVIEAARDYFDLDTSNIRVIEGDGKWYLNETEKKYDAVILDAFSGEGSPSHLMSVEAFLAARRVLKPDGILVINTFVDFSSPTDFLGASLSNPVRGLPERSRPGLEGREHALRGVDAFAPYHAPRVRLSGCIPMPSPTSSPPMRAMEARPASGIVPRTTIIPSTSARRQARANSAKPSLGDGRAS